MFDWLAHRKHKISGQKCLRLIVNWQITIPTYDLNHNYYSPSCYATVGIFQMVEINVEVERCA